VLDLLDEPAVLTKKIKRAVTDTETEVRYDPERKPGVSNLLTILSVFTGREVEALQGDYAGRGYGALKGDVADALVGFTTPFRERTEAWLADQARLDEVLADGTSRARKVAAETLARVYDAVGFVPARP
jgi:tryptophanyl-tRNA synthetase